MNQEISFQNMAKIVSDQQGQLINAKNIIAAQQNAFTGATTSYQQLRSDLQANKPSPAKLKNVKMLKVRDLSKVGVHI